MKSLAKILRIQKEISPKSYFEELAENGLLYDYVHKYYPKKLKTDREFRNDVYDLISREEGFESGIATKYYLERLVESFGFFKEYTKEWTIRNNSETK